jgi:thioredoxin-related protein
MSMKNIVAIALFLIAAFSLKAQQPVIIYNPLADAKQEIKQAVERASVSEKHVFLQIGGNWCPWCLRFHKFLADDTQLDSLVKANYEVVFVNFSRENQNLEVLANLGYPQRFGFPVFVILDDKGNRLHTQDTSLLEDANKSYDRSKVMTMFTMWSPEAIRKSEEKYK